MTRKIDNAPKIPIIDVSEHEKFLKKNYINKGKISGKYVFIHNVKVTLNQLYTLITKQKWMGSSEVISLLEKNIVELKLILKRDLDSSYIEPLLNNIEDIIKLAIKLQNIADKKKFKGLITKITNVKEMTRIAISQVQKLENFKGKIAIFNNQNKVFNLNEFENLKDEYEFLKSNKKNLTDIQLQKLDVYFNFIEKKFYKNFIKPSYKANKQETLKKIKTPEPAEKTTIALIEDQIENLEKQKIYRKVQIEESKQEIKFEEASFFYNPPEQLEKFVELHQEEVATVLNQDEVHEEQLNSLLNDTNNGKEMLDNLLQDKIIEKIIAEKLEGNLSEIENQINLKIVLNDLKEEKNQVVELTNETNQKIKEIIEAKKNIKTTSKHASVETEVKLEEVEIEVKSETTDKKEEVEAEKDKYEDYAENLRAQRKVVGKGIKIQFKKAKNAFEKKEIIPNFKNLIFEASKAGLVKSLGYWKGEKSEDNQKLKFLMENLENGIAPLSSSQGVLKLIEKGLIQANQAKLDSKGNFIINKENRDLLKAYQKTLKSYKKIIGMFDKNNYLKFAVSNLVKAADFLSIKKDLAGSENEEGKLDLINLISTTYLLDIPLKNSENLLANVYKDLKFIEGILVETNRAWIGNNQSLVIANDENLEVHYAEVMAIYSALKEKAIEFSNRIPNEINSLEKQIDEFGNGSLGIFKEMKNQMTTLKKKSNIDKKALNELENKFNELNKKIIETEKKSIVLEKEINNYQMEYKESRTRIKEKALIKMQDAFQLLQKSPGGDRKKLDALKEKIGIAQKDLELIQQKEALPNNKNLIWAVHDLLSEMSVIPLKKSYVQKIGESIFGSNEKKLKELLTKLKLINLNYTFQNEHKALSKVTNPLPFTSEIIKLVQVELVNAKIANPKTKEQSFSINEQFSELHTAYVVTVKLQKEVNKKINNLENSLKELYEQAKHKGLIDSLGFIKGEWSKENSKLKELLNKKLTKESNPNLIASDILFLIEKGLLQLNIATRKENQKLGIEFKKRSKLWEAYEAAQSALEELKKIENPVE